MNIIYATKWGLTSTPILKFTDTHRTFRRYRNYYEFLTEMPRFKHCTISFRRMRDIIPQIRKWFQSAERYQELIFCQEDSGDLISQF